MYRVLATGDGRKKVENMLLQLNNAEAVSMKCLRDIKILLHKHIYSKNGNIILLQEMLSRINNYDKFEISYDENERLFNIRIPKTILKKMKKETHVKDMNELNQYVFSLFMNRLHEFIAINKKEIRLLINLSFNNEEEKQTLLYAFTSILVDVSLTAHLFHFFPMEDNYYMIKL